MFIKNLKEILFSEPSYREKQVDEAIFKKLVIDWNEATNLSLELREKLEQKCPPKIKGKMIKSQDKNTAKALIFLEDGEKIETVLMRHQDGRDTICVSSQVGCSLSCQFCATGKMGFKRNLTSEEIIIQVLYWARYLKKESQRVSNVVFMGMGEPFLNYDEVMTAIGILNDPNKFNIGSRRISISTCGIVEGIEKLSQEKLQINLALSLHASSDKLRSKLMPINKLYSLKKILSEIKKYIKKTKRKVMIEYVMLSGINDNEENARELVSLLKERLDNLYFVNLISYNKTGQFLPSSREKIKKFKRILENSGITVTERFRFGEEIKGACGQLVG